MAHYGPAPEKPDGRVFASYPMPAKIDLIKERPRRESLVEKELENKIGEPAMIPKIEVSNLQSTSQQRSTGGNNEHQHQVSSFNTNQQQQQQYQQYPTQQQQMVQQISTSTTTTSGNTTDSMPTALKVLNRTRADNAALYAAELAEKEAKLMAEINALHQRPYSPFQRPDKIDLTNEQRIAQQQIEHASPSPRPYSRASSTRSQTASADLLDKEAKLLQEIEEMEKKPFNPQTMVVEREQWYEFPEGRPQDRLHAESKRRVKDFCSLPEYMYPQEGRHIHEEGLASLPRRGQQVSSPSSSVHTTIIRSPKREIDNKSPLPFAFDNFSTKGVRGNLASVGAIEPDRPRPPIYPIIKRSPSPNTAARG